MNFNIQDLLNLGKKSLLGVDVGSSSIKIAELTVSRKGTVLNSFGMIPTPPQATSGGDIIDSSLISESVRQLLGEINSKRKNAAAGLWGASVIVKRITIPRMEESLIAEQIRWEAEQYIPYDINEVNLDYKVLDLVQDESENMDILLIAAVHDMIFGIAELISEAGLVCSVLDIEGFALANCFEVNYGILPGEIVALVNIGAAVTNFVVIEQGEVVFCRDIPIGGLMYTNELAKSLGMSMTEAEGVKLSIGAGQPAPEEAGQIIEATHGIMIEEVGGSIDFFHNTSNGVSLSRMFVTGGGAKTLGLYQALGSLIPLERFDPFVSVQANSKSFSPEYLNQIRDYAAIAMGLGMREVGD